MLKRFCDICGKEIYNKDFKILRFIEPDDAITVSSLFQPNEFEICPDCEQKIRDVKKGE